MYINLALVGKLILTEAAQKAANEGINILDNKLDMYVKLIKRKIRGD